jgi:hypothetical protein
MLQATEAKSLGIVLDTVPVAQLAGSAVAVARSIAAKPPQALRMTKRLMKCGQHLELPDFLELCAVFQGICHNTQCSKESAITPQTIRRRLRPSSRSVDPNSSEPEVPTDTRCDRDDNGKSVSDGCDASRPGSESRIKSTAAAALRLAISMKVARIAFLESCAYRRSPAELHQRAQGSEGSVFGFGIRRRTGETIAYSNIALWTAGSVGVRSGGTGTLDT